MRKPSPEPLCVCVRDFVRTIGVLPHWVDTTTAEENDKGHYEWVHWGEALRPHPMWEFGGPWRSLVADIKMANLLVSIEYLHELKEQIIWEIVEQVYKAAEAARNSTTPVAKIKARIRSVHSWQQRHFEKKHTLLSFLDFAFVLSAYDEFQAERQFIDPALTDPVLDVPALPPNELVAHAAALEIEMLHARRLPFYARVDGLDDSFTLQVRLAAIQFCDGLAPPFVDMEADVRETRGMPRSEKAVDFTTVWLTLLQENEYIPRWNCLIDLLLRCRQKIESLESWEALLKEVSRAIIATTISHAPPLGGFRDDVLPYVASQQRHLHLKVPRRIEGQKRKKYVYRVSFRAVMESRLKFWERINGPHGLSLVNMDRYEDLQTFRGRGKRTFDDFASANVDYQTQ